jgi:two-component system cell cycle sensor histidine kinase/response regulator CckA
MPKPRILVVDDERVVIEVLSSLLEDPDRELVTAETATAALQHARAGELAVALVDKNLGSDSGLALSRELKQLQPELEVILITGFASIESAIEAVQIGAFDYLTKPITDFSALSFKVQSAIEKSALRRQQRALLERLMEYEVRHRRLIDAAPEAIVLYEAETGRVVEANQAAVKLYGYPPEELLLATAADLRGGAPEEAGPMPRRQRHRRKDGSELAVEVTFTGYQHQGRALRVQSARDVTDREAADERRRDLEERLHAAGKLAAAVAQDFGGLLAGISKRASALESVLTASPDAGTDVASILEAAARGLALIRELERYSAGIGRNGAPPELREPVRGNG